LLAGYDRAKVRFFNGQPLVTSLDVFRAIGLLGAVCFIGAYFATQQRWLNSDDWRYPAFNLVGSLLVMVSLFAEWNLPSVVLELFWAAISVYGLVHRA
jgi:hypothetical protein